MSGDFLRWLNTFYDTGGTVLGIDLMDSSDFWCKTIYSLRYAGQMLSAMITVAITIQRTLCIFQPLRASTLATPRRAKIIIAAIFVVGSLLGLSCCFIIRLSPWNDAFICGYSDRRKYYIWYWVVVRMLTMVIPWFVLAVLTCAISIRLRRVKKFRSQSSSANKGHSIYQGVEKQLTRMLLLVVVAFVLLRAPYIVSYDLLHHRWDIWENLTRRMDVTLTAVNDFCDCISSLNYCINFFLYFVSGSVFRAQFIQVFCSPCRTEQGQAVDSQGVPLNTTKTTPFSSLSNIHKTCLQPMNSVPAS